METKKEEKKVVKKTTKKKEERKRRFMFQRNYFFETHDEDGNKTSDITDDEWKEKVLKEIFDNEKLKIAEYIMLIFHDRDVVSDETGELKTLHCHGVLVYEHAQYVENIREYVKAQERNFEILQSEAGAVRYLTHTTDEAMRDKKIRYNVSEIYLKERNNNDFIVGDELEKFYREKISSKAQANNELRRRLKKTAIDEAIQLILNNELKDMVDVQKYVVEDCGLTLSEFLTKRKLFDDAFEHKKNVIIKERTGKSRYDLRLIYIQGASNVGKTKLAKLLARCFNVSVNEDEDSIFNTATNGEGKTYDFYQNYNYEKSAIFDEQDLIDLGYGQFKQMFDKNLLSTVASRFKNKVFLSDFNFIIKSEDIERQIESICSSEVSKIKKDYYLTDNRKDFEIENIYKQIKRRFDLIIHIDENKIDLFVFNEKNNFKEFIEKYNMTDMYSAGFYPFSTQEEKWAYWSKHIHFNQYTDNGVQLYSR